MDTTEEQVLVKAQQAEQLARASRLVRAATGDDWGDGYIVTDMGIGIAEPGYPEEAVWVAGNWNSKRFPRDSEPPLTLAESLPVRLAEALERRIPGIELLWLDEWLTCDQCHRAIRSQPDSYSWLPSYVATEDGYYCLDDITEDDIDQYVNAPKKALTFTYPLAENGWQRYKPSIEQAGQVPTYRDSDAVEFEAGWHPGQDAEPEQIYRQARADGWPEVIFSVDSSGQFDIAFSVWVRTARRCTGSYCMTVPYPDRIPLDAEEQAEGICANCIEEADARQDAF